MKYAINLLPKKEVPVFDRLVYFSLNYLRYIIILTQLVVIAVFFYRFQIDQHIIDLKESVDQKKEIVQVVLPLLNEAQTIDMRTSQIQKVLQNQVKFTSLFQYLTSVFPSSIALQKFDLDGDTIKIAGNAADARLLQAFYSVLTRDNKFKTVSLESIKKTDEGYAFTLSMKQYGKN